MMLYFLDLAYITLLMHVNHANPTWNSGEPNDSERNKVMVSCLLPGFLTGV